MKKLLMLSLLFLNNSSIFAQQKQSYSRMTNKNVIFQVNDLVFIKYADTIIRVEKILSIDGHIAKAETINKDKFYTQTDYLDLRDENIISLNAKYNTFGKFKKNMDICMLSRSDNSINIHNLLAVNNYKGLYLTSPEHEEIEIDSRTVFVREVDLESKDLKLKTEGIYKNFKSGQNIFLIDEERGVEEGAIAFTQAEIVCIVDHFAEIKISDKHKYYTVKNGTYKEFYSEKAIYNNATIDLNDSYISKSKP